MDVTKRGSLMRSCQNCYFASYARKLGGSWWCRCANPGRSTESNFMQIHWGKSRLNLPCWKERTKIVYEDMTPIPMQRYRVKRIPSRRWYNPNSLLTIPRSYVLRSKIRNLLTRSRNLHQSENGVRSH